LSSLDAGYDEEGGGTDDSSSTSGAADGKPWLELRCVLAVIRHGDRTPKQKMKVTVTQVGLSTAMLMSNDPYTVAVSFLMFRMAERVGACIVLVVQRS
jgi:hypothetical protein